MRARLWAGVAVSITLTCVTGCSSSTNGKPAAVGSSSPGSSPASATSSSASGPATTDQATAALLNAADIGSGFALGTYTPSKDAQPCAAKGSPPLNQEVPPTVSVGREFDNATAQAALQEEISVYPDVDTAKHALDVGTAGMTCSTGTIYHDDGTTDSVTISAAQDMSAALGLPVDAATSWSLSNQTLQGTLLVVRTGAVLTALSFAAAAGTDDSKLPDALAIAKAAISKVSHS